MISLIKYDPLQPSEDNNYCLFKKTFEDDPKVFFHITEKINLTPIISTGFKSAFELDKGDLKSISYANKSSTCLSFYFNNFEEDMIVFAVSFTRLDAQGIKINPSDIHVFDKKIQPEILGYCEVPRGFTYY